MYSTTSNYHQATSMNSSVSVLFVGKNHRREVKVGVESRNIKFLSNPGFLLAWVTVWKSKRNTRWYKRGDFWRGPRGGKRFINCLRTPLCWIWCQAQIWQNWCCAAREIMLFIGKPKGRSRMISNRSSSDPLILMPQHFSFIWTSTQQQKRLWDTFSA